MSDSAKIKENTQKLLYFIMAKFENNELDNDSLVQLIELSAGYLNLRTRTEYAKQRNKSYNGAKNFRRNIRIAGKAFIIDND
jgi:hypothetical protein